MPIPKVTRINPLDLQKNIIIGISLPFKGPSGPFNKTYSTREQTKYNLINLLLTDKGERLFNPEYGSNLSNILFENIKWQLDDDLHMPCLLENIPKYKCFKCKNTVEYLVNFNLCENCNL